MRVQRGQRPLFQPLILKRRNIRWFYARGFELVFFNFETPKMAAPAKRQATVIMVIFFFISEPPS
jgi:hypothetical protein